MTCLANIDNFRLGLDCHLDKVLPDQREGQHGVQPADLGGRELVSARNAGPANRVHIPGMANPLAENSGQIQAYTALNWPDRPRVSKTVNNGHTEH